MLFPLAVWKVICVVFGALLLVPVGVLSVEVGVILTEEYEILPPVSVGAVSYLVVEIVSTATPFEEVSSWRLLVE